MEAWTRCPFGEHAITDWLYSDTSGRFGDGDYERLKKFTNDHSAVSADESDPSSAAGGP
jgi:hypothetical protein